MPLSTSQNVIREGDIFARSLADLWHSKYGNHSGKRHETAFISLFASDISGYHSVPWFVVPDRLLECISPGLTLTSRRSSFDTLKSFGPYLTLQWLVKVNRVAIELGSRGFSLKLYLSNLLEILSSESTQVDRVGFMNTRPNFLLVECSLDACLHMLIQSLSFYLGSCLASFVEFTAAFPDNWDSPFSVRSKRDEIVRTVDDIFVAYCLHTGESLLEIKSLLNSHGLRLPYILCCPCFPTRSSQHLSEDLVVPSSTFSNLLSWLEARSVPTKRSIESSARREFIHLVALAELSMIDFSDGMQLALACKLLQHGDTFPRKLRERLCNVLMAMAPAPECALLRHYARINIDHGVLDPGEILSLRTNLPK